MLMPESCPEDKDEVETHRHKAGLDLVSKSCLGILSSRRDAGGRSRDEEPTKVCCLEVSPSSLDAQCERGLIRHSCLPSLSTGMESSSV